MQVKLYEYFNFGKPKKEIGENVDEYEIGELYYQIEKVTEEEKCVFEGKTKKYLRRVRVERITTNGIVITGY